MAAQIVTLKLSLNDANLIKESLHVHLDVLMEGIETAGESDKLKIGAIDTLLRRDFG